MDFYERSCMTVVNQCVGRAIRHKNDFASMLYFDLRYNRLNHQKNIPNWIRSNMKRFDTLHPLTTDLSEVI